MKTASTWLSFGVGAGDVPPREATLREAQRAGGAAVAVEWVDNLCRRAEEIPPRLPPVLWTATPLVLCASRPRAVRALLEHAGVPLASRSVRWIEARPAASDRAWFDTRTTLPDEPGWTPWYPVLDRSRCICCGQCVQFCLFGVYENGEDGIPRVANPRSCKDRCPACARICPGAAIIFPRYEEAPFDGSAVEASDQRVSSRQDALRQLLGSDPLAGLRARQERAAALRSHAAGIPPLVDPAALDRALFERARASAADTPPRSAPSTATDNPGEPS